MASHDEIGLREELIHDRGRMLRLLRSERAMLLEALQANRRGKADVVEDHVERVLERMMAEQKRLEDIWNNGG